MQSNYRMHYLDLLLPAVVTLDYSALIDRTLQVCALYILCFASFHSFAIISVTMLVPFYAPVG